MNQKGFVRALVIIILGVIILAGGYFYFSKKPTNAPADEISKEDINQDMTLNWQIYRNDGMGFTIKYPADFIVVATSPQDEYYIGFDSKTKQTQVCFDMGCQKPGIIIEKNPSNWKSEREFIANILPPTQKIIEKNSIVVSGKTFSKLVIQQVSGFKEYILLYEKDNNLFYFSTNTEGNYLDILEKMLDTLKFTK